MMYYNLIIFVFGVHYVYCSALETVLTGLNVPYDEDDTGGSCTINSHSCPNPSTNSNSKAQHDRPSKHFLTPQYDIDYDDLPAYENNNNSLSGGNQEFQQQQQQEESGVPQTKTGLGFPDSAYYHPENNSLSYFDRISSPTAGDSFFGDIMSEGSENEVFGGVRRKMQDMMSCIIPRTKNFLKQMRAFEAEDFFKSDDNVLNVQKGKDINPPLAPAPSIMSMDVPKSVAISPLPKEIKMNKSNNEKNTLSPAPVPKNYSSYYSDKIVGGETPKYGDHSDNGGSPQGHTPEQNNSNLNSYDSVNQDNNSNLMNRNVSNNKIPARFRQGSRQGRNRSSSVLPK